MIRAIILLLLAGCAHSQSASSSAAVEQQTHATQDATQTVKQETHSDDGGWTVEKWEFAPGPSSPGGSDPRASAVHELGGIAKLAPGSVDRRAVPDVPTKVAHPPDAGHPSFLAWPMDGDAPLLSYTKETHAPAHTETTTVAGATEHGTKDTTLKAESASESASKWKVGLPWGLILGLAGGAALAFWKRKVIAGLVAKVLA